MPNTPRRAPRPPLPGAPRAAPSAGLGGTGGGPGGRRSRRACACIGSAPKRIHGQLGVEKIIGKKPMENHENLGFANQNPGFG